MPVSAELSRMSNVILCSIISTPFLRTADSRPYGVDGAAFGCRGSHWLSAFLPTVQLIYKLFAVIIVYAACVVVGFNLGALADNVELVHRLLFLFLLA